MKMPSLPALLIKCPTMKRRSQRLRRCIFVALASALLLVVAYITSQQPLGRHSMKRFPVLYKAYRGLKSLTPEEAGSGQHRLKISLQKPAGIVADETGRTVFSDRVGYVWQIDADGTASIIAGTGVWGLATAGIEAVKADLGMPEGVCLDQNGDVLFADSDNHVVLRIDASGMLQLVAGSPERVPGYSGDGGPATKARLFSPFAVRVDSKGDIFIADTDNHRIRRIASDGTITTVAGTGEPGHTGDGGPATGARLNTPWGLFVDPEDRVVVGDSLNHVVRRISKDGIIETIAGDGKARYNGKSGPATKVSLNAPQGLYALPSGEVYVGDEHNNCIRLIDTNAQLSTVIGDGVSGRSSEGTSAVNARLNDPEEIWVNADGSLLVNDSSNQRILRVTPDRKIELFAGKE